MRVIVVSLLANVVLLAALAWRPSLAPPVVREFLVHRLHFGPASSAGNANPASSPTPTTARSSTSAATNSPLLGLAFATEDFTALSAKMRAAGFPAGIIAEILRREIDAKYDVRINALTALDPHTPFWKTSPTAIAASARIGWQMSQLTQEREKAYRGAINDPFFFQESALDIGQRRMWGDLPRDKLDRIQRIEDDYADMISSARTAANGVLLAEDRNKLELLEREKQSDIAALLSPDELAEYKLRSGATGVAARLRLFNPSEAEYRMVAQAHNETNTRFNPIVPDNSPAAQARQMDQRREALQAFEAQMKASLGNARYADFLVTTNPEFLYLTQIAEADRVSPAAARQAFDLRDQVARESTRIFDDATLDPAQKRTALQALAQNTRNQLLSVLGPTSGPGYVKMADNWLNNVASGSAVSFNTTAPLGSTTTSYRRLPGSPPPGSTATPTLIRTP